MRFLFLLLLISCAKSEADNALFFTQEITNYGIMRYENSEAICYQRAEAFTCMPKQ